MDSFPGNSHVGRAAQGTPSKPVVDPEEAAKTEPKKVEKVVTGKVSRRKKPLGTRFREFLFSGDTQSVGNYVIFDVLLPAIKDTIADVVSQGIERMLFGEARSTSRRTGSRPSGPQGYVSYNRYASPTIRRDDPRPGINNRARAVHNFDDIILATRPEAEEVIDRMFSLISRYGSATVSDLYELLGISGNYTDEKWGWEDFRGAGITRISNGYLLDLPKPEHLS